MKNFTLLLVLSLLTFSAFTQQATFNWVTQTISEDNNLQGMTITGDTSAVLIGYDNTFKKSIDKGLTWTDIKAFDPEFDFIGMSSAGDISFISSRRAKIVDHPSGGATDVYVSGVLLKSIDKGSTWELVDITGMGTGEDASVNPNAKGSYAKDVYAIGALNADTLLVYSGWYDISTGTKTTEGGVFRTNDGGANWETLVSGLGSSFITSIAAVDSVAIIAGNKSLYKTNLLTNVTTDIYPNLALGTDSNLFVNNITAINTETFYVTTISDGAFKTIDGGQSFTKLDGITGGNDLLVVNDSSLIILGSSAKSKLSTDNGATWTDCYPGATCYKIGGILGDTLYGLANTDAYKISVNDLVAKNFNWSTVEIADNKRLQKMAIFDNTTAVIAAYGENCKKTIDGGQTWADAILPSDYEEDVEFDFNSISANEASAYSVIRRYKIADLPSSSTVPDFYMEGIILKTTNNWETVDLLKVTNIGKDDGTDATKNPQTAGCYALNPYTIYCVDENTAYLYANWYENVITPGVQDDHGRVFKTIDGGDSWTAITKDFEGSYINAISFSGDTGYIAGNKVLLKTIDAGATFTDLYPTLAAANKDSSIFLKNAVMINGNEIYIPTTSDGVFYTMDGGTTFSKFETVTGTNDFYKLDGNSFICLGSTSKSHFTNDGGTTWQNASVGTTIYSIGEVLNDSLYALGKGIVAKIALSDLDLKTAVDVFENINELKVQYHPNYINIVSTTKNIDRCYVYSIEGKLVSIVEPNAKNVQLNNHEFKTGIYIIAASIEGKKYTTKIVFK